jgi:glycosyltransferase involved in cell wall biosynthesis
VGRLSREKGADVLIDALAHLRDVSFRAEIIGDGVELEKLKQQARDRRIDHRVTWHGIIPEAANCVTAFDLLVLSSRREGTPMVLFEAMAASVPVVATKVGGVPDVVSPVEALLVPPKRPPLLAQAIRSIYEDRAAALARAEIAQKRLDDFALVPWLRQHEALYQQLQYSLG